MLTTDKIFANIREQIEQDQLGTQQVISYFLLAGLVKLLAILGSKYILTEDEIGIIINSKI